MKRAASLLCLFAMNTFVTAGFVALAANYLVLKARGISIAGFVLLDASAYFSHVLFHEVRYLERFHRVHHNDSLVDPWTNLRTHFGQLIWYSTFFQLVAYLFGISAPTVMVYQTCVFALGFWQHSKMKQPSRWEKTLSTFLVTPYLHRKHHEVSNENYFGSVLSCWDILFKTNITRTSRHTEQRQIPLWKEALVGVKTFIVACLIAISSHASTNTKSHPVYDELAKYGEDLINRTAYYFGPKGTVSRNTKSRMACRNCHLEGATKSYGFSLQWAHGKFPAYLGRGGKVVTLMDRINNCFERPMNAKRLALDSKEMLALLVYFKKLNDALTPEQKAKPERINDMITLNNRAADPKNGALLYQKHCVQCHGKDGSGQLEEDKIQFQYPPTWGEESYGAGSNMFRVIKLAAFIRANMPLGTEAAKPLLTSDEALDLAAFINDDSIHKRPRYIWSDYPVVTEKPIDFPFGPYPDALSQKQHKFGPFLPIIKGLAARGIQPYY